MKPACARRSSKLSTAAGGELFAAAGDPCFAAGFGAMVGPSGGEPADDALFTAVGRSRLAGGASGAGARSGTGARAADGFGWLLDGRPSTAANFAAARATAKRAAGESNSSSSLSSMVMTEP